MIFHIEFALLRSKWTTQQGANEEKDLGLFMKLSVIKNIVLVISYRLSIWTVMLS